ncbi:two-component sensor histidine kinase [Desulfosarcina ovata subsp. sediminis]|uniref:histidine kinase n=1 Tax=Desulfosarcina ovata subsp. sediminis TaxID=885957 RepID=A0A5K7ZV69_9BACT|nr:PAS domain-containing sensor histidine kinase [Desulfosarcina ovata]BBO84074.1 two-component sensor histidine kinase [Desulfosarcina ovata subsp. sediminis]
MQDLPSDHFQNGDTPTPDEDRQARYRRLFYRFVLLTLVCSVVPLLLVGWGMNIKYNRFGEEQVMTEFRKEVQHHRKVIELFLEEQCDKLALMAATHSRQNFSRPGFLRSTFDLFNKEHWTLTDIGVIDDQGDHLAYVGPYDLLDKNYKDAHWFKMVMEKGLYISDMFMGFRREPHFIIAVRGNDEDGPWTLRATVDTEAFRSLVENVMIGRTGEVFLVNREGIYQTTPRYSGRIMEPAAIDVGEVHPGIRVRQEAADAGFNGERSVQQIVSTAWLETPQWMLVVRQDKDEAFGAENQANFSVLIFLHVTAATILVVTVLVTRYMLNLVKRKDAEADALNSQLMQTSKMASIGELSAGVAHEINNPLAIISTEREIVLDAYRRVDDMDAEFGVQLDDSLNQIDVQIKRCKRITHNLLRFSRRTQSVIDTVDINAFIGEVVDLMAREAKSSGISFLEELSPEVPPILSDLSQLQQVFLNLITNAIDAHENKQYGSISIRTDYLEPDGIVEIVVSDTGSGIPEEKLAKIFDPFFTTKPMGRGTGLGLSICYGIIQRLGGEISVKSVVNQGTDFTIRLPLRSPDAQPDSVHAYDQQVEKAA